jgi:uncharacterized protein YbjT (DUF2867 family)
MTGLKPILITGASGNIGGVGNTLTRLLLKRGKQIRAMVRREDERSESLRLLGAEIVVGDLLSLSDMHRAIEGCGSLYFSMTVSPEYLAATVNVAAVAKHHGIEAFVNMSQLTVSQMSITETTSSPQHKLHWLAEQTLNWSGLPVVHVRPTMFMDGFFLKFSAHSIKNFNEIRVPFGLGKTSPIAARDVALALSVILEDPQLHIGTTIELTGPQSENMTFYADEVSDVLGRTIKYVDVPPGLWHEDMGKSGLSEHVLDHLSTMGELHREGRYDRMTDQFARLTGKRPMCLRDFIHEHASALERENG